MKIQLAVATAAALLSSVNAAVSPLANFAAETADVESVGERKRGHASKGGVDPEAIIDLYYETGGLSRLPDDEDFDYYF
ncbi:hypothetical protein THAOC_08729 [Thalassiosira oceanica]|uniref:RxLR effector protein n=1 Tax=Thalassiosira oceanica TaxID=159749 RepID=K0THJ3_THAOC|nr:hypothetical protein THAOC_08729 [Thalassiosira oceanica]|eukprot:EJK69962.1 hypothetical protein THAOC_08729 [Thalassiosira oceanica]